MCYHNHYPSDHMQWPASMRERGNASVVEKLPERVIPVRGYDKYAAPVARLPMANHRLSHGE